MLFYTILGLDWAKFNVFWPILMVLRQFFTLLRQCLIKLSLMENLGSASAVTQWLPALKQAYFNAN